MDAEAQLLAQGPLWRKLKRTGLTKDEKRLQQTRFAD